MRTRDGFFVTAELLEEDGREPQVAAFAVDSAARFVGGRARGRHAQQQAQQQTQSTQKATAEQIEAFKKAFSVCLEAKKYMVKY